MSDRAPNVLILYVDQQRYDALGCVSPHVRTPNLDRLAARGVRFARHYVQNPVCMPSRISMLTGRYPSNLGITHMGVPVPEDTVTLPVLLGRAGYHTANIGKLHFLPHSNRDHARPHPAYGFDHLEISDEPGPYDDAYRAFVRRTMPDQLPHISQHVDPPAAPVWRSMVNHRDGIDHPAEWEPWQTTPFAGAEDATHTAFVGRRTAAFVEQRATAGSWLCIAGFYSPHSPLVAPQRFLDLYDPADLPVPPLPPELTGEAQRLGFTEAHRRQMAHGYLAMVSEVDHWVGHVLDTLDRTGQTDETLVVFTSDHGEYLGEHLKVGKWHPAPDCVSRVPLILAGPGFGGGAVVEDVVEAVDITPTLLRVAGVAVPPEVDGTPLDERRDKAALMEDTGREEGAWRSLRDARWRYILHADGSERLHDCDAEFGEYRDVAAEHPAELQRWRHTMATRLLNVATPLPREWCY